MTPLAALAALLRVSEPDLARQLAGWSDRQVRQAHALAEQAALDAARRARYEVAEERRERLRRMFQREEET